jgi:hypothetical protein
MLFHADVEEARRRIRLLIRSGHDVDLYEGSGLAGMRARRNDPPDIFVIDLDRLPSRGRAIAVWLRQQKAFRHVPILLAGGDREKVEQARVLLPDAAFTAWKRIRGSIRSAIKRAPVDPVVPGTMDGYRGTPLAKKLGIKEGCRLALLAAPAGFEQTLGTLPADVRIRHSARGKAEVILLFAGSMRELERRFRPAARMLSDGGRLWIVWPKKSSGRVTDLSLTAVRAFGLDAHFVDYKISAIDATWSGLCFARRRR